MQEVAQSQTQERAKTANTHWDQSQKKTFSRIIFTQSYFILHNLYICTFFPFRNKVRLFNAVTVWPGHMRPFYGRTLFHRKNSAVYLPSWLYIELWRSCLSCLFIGPGGFTYSASIDLYSSTKLGLRQVEKTDEMLLQLGLRNWWFGNS